MKTPADVQTKIHAAQQPQVGAPPKGAPWDGRMTDRRRLAGFDLGEFRGIDAGMFGGPIAKPKSEARAPSATDHAQEYERSAPSRERRGPRLYRSPAA